MLTGGARLWFSFGDLLHFLSLSLHRSSRVLLVIALLFHYNTMNLGGGLEQGQGHTRFLCRHFRLHGWFL